MLFGKAEKVIQIYYRKMFGGMPRGAPRGLPYFSSEKCV